MNLQVNYCMVTRSTKQKWQGWGVMILQGMWNDTVSSTPCIECTLHTWAYCWLLHTSLESQDWRPPHPLFFKPCEDTIQDTPSRSVMRKFSVQEQRPESHAGLCPKQTVASSLNSGNHGFCWFSDPDGGRSVPCQMSTGCLPSVQQQTADSSEPYSLRLCPSQREASTCSLVPCSRHSSCCYDYISCHPQLTWQNTALPTPSID